MKKVLLTISVMVAIIISCNNSTDLKELEAAITKLEESRRDASEAFDNYDRKNQSYYLEADRYIARLSDSLLRNKIKSRIAASLEKHSAGTNDFKKLLKEMDTKSVTLSDWHSTLKVAITLPIIEKYQQDSKPSTQPLQNYIKEQDKTINKIKTETKD